MYIRSDNKNLMQQILYFLKILLGFVAFAFTWAICLVLSPFFLLIIIGSYSKNLLNKFMSNNKSTVNVGCGCYSLILTILILSALFFGLPTPWGVFEIDLLPPGIYLNR